MLSKGYRLYRSCRGHVLLYHGDPQDKPVLCVEDYCKWYEIFAIMPVGNVVAIMPASYQMVDLKVGNCWSDHCINPKACQGIADTLGAVWCDRSLEVITGRYQLKIIGENQFDDSVVDDEKLEFKVLCERAAELARIIKASDLSVRLVTYHQPEKVFFIYGAKTAEWPAIKKLLINGKWYGWSVKLLKDNGTELLTRSQE